MAQFCPFCGVAMQVTERNCRNCGAPNEAFAPPVGGVGVPSSQGPWAFESSVSGCGDRLVGSMGLNRTGAPMGLLEMMIRGAFLDGNVYRRAAADTNGNGSALIAIVIPVVAGLLGGLLGFRSLFWGNVVGRAHCLARAGHLFTGRRR